jgi:CO/xanthine dehydrogenase FAD-binding subunit
MLTESDRREADPVTGTMGTLHRPGTVGEAVQVLAELGDAELLAGGTDLVPALRAEGRRPRAIVALRRVLELRARGAAADTLTIGAGVTYTELADWSPSPGLAATARAVGSAQIRNSGTVGGALGTANPQGDLLTYLTAAGADVLTCSARAGARSQPLADYLARAPRTGAAGGTGPVRRRGELVTAVRVPATRGPQVFLKTGGRQAAYPALVSCALVVDTEARRAGCALGGIAVAPVRATAAEDFAVAEVDWAAAPVAGGVAEALGRRFGELVAAAARDAPAQLPPGPRDPAEYRWHAAGVLAARALARCLAAPPVPPEPAGSQQHPQGHR